MVVVLGYDLVLGHIKQLNLHFRRGLPLIRRRWPVATASFPSSSLSSFLLFFLQQRRCLPLKSETVLPSSGGGVVDPCEKREGSDPKNIKKL